MPPKGIGDATPAGEDDIDAALVWTAIRVGRRLERWVAERLAGFGLAPLQFGMLAYLSVRPGLSQSELARAVHVRPQSARETVLGMIERGLLDRVEKPSRGRAAELRLTAQGQALLAQAWPALTGLGAAELGIEPADAATLNRLLHVLLAHTGGPAAPCLTPGPPRRDGPGWVDD